MSTYGEALPTAAQGGVEPPGWDEAESIDAIPLRHWGRWVSAAIILFVLFALLWSLWHNPRVDISYVLQTLTAPFVLRGVVVTIELTIIAMVIGIAGGVTLAVMRLSPNPVLKAVAWGSTMRRMVRPPDMPSEWAASYWPLSTEMMPARTSSAA